MKMLAMLCVCLFPLLMRAEPAPQPLTANAVFGSHAVLQCGMPLPVWGTAQPGTTVTVAFAGQTARAITTADGRWRATLSPLNVCATPQTMTIACADATLVYDDILVGEVWLVCGRSNIGFVLSRMLNASNEIARANQPLLRLMSVAEKDPSPTPKTEFKRRGWVAAASQGQLAGAFSAVGWIFGAELQKARTVPVGIVISTWGGSRPSLWIERAYYDAHRTGAAKQPNAAQRQFEQQSQAYHKATDGQSAAQLGTTPGACFNSHIHPLIPMAMRGVLIFFDGGEPDDIKLLAQNWRGLWGRGDFPYIYIQVHRQGGPLEMDPNLRADACRSAYVNLLKTIPNSAMVVTLDTGVTGAKDIHPPNKRPVGERAALAARALAYGEKIVASGPLAARVTAQGNKAIVQFDHVGGGLVAKGGPLEGFAASTDGKTWVWATARIVSNTVVVTADGLPRIAAVRYAFAPNNPKGNLYNNEGLPASPFSQTAQHNP
jgi:sialate O-acetylesterase